MFRRVIFVLVVLFINNVSCSRPCDGRIMVVLDASSSQFDTFDTTLFNNQNNLVKKLFTSPYFEDFERMSIGYYGGYLYDTPEFGEFQSQTQVDSYVDSVSQDSQHASYLEGLLAYLYDYYTPLRSGGQDITIVIFVSYIRENVVDEARQYAKEIQDYGVRLVLIAHTTASEGDDFDIARLVQITDNENDVFNWIAKKTLPADDYQQWFSQVIGCPQAAITTLKPSTSLCDGQIVIMLDASMSWEAFSKQQFDDEKELIKKLFVGPYFKNFERLAIGSYALRANLSNFGDLHSESDVASHVHSIQEDATHITWLTNALNDTYNKNYQSDWGDKINIIFFVSDIEEYEVNLSRPFAKKLQDQGIRLVLIGHGNFKQDYVSVDRLARVTGDASAVFKWNDGESLPSDDYQQWFRQVLACPN
ncbi:hypothetical protein M3Y95_00390800 [Aphelenchoides besseyi]|nr:hypothetical protein M3Y95_00390800 [Aphelenchoides besseyi]